jgi:hypothetical protein
MAVAARKAEFQSEPAGVARPAPRLAEDTDFAGPTAVHAQQRALEAAFSGRHAHPRLRAVSYTLATLACFGVWAAIISAAAHVGRMVHP